MYQCNYIQYRWEVPKFARARTIGNKAVSGSQVAMRFYSTSIANIDVIDYFCHY